MNFDGALEIVSDALRHQEIELTTEDYDGLIVKILRSSNTLDDGRTTNQTHIAVTGEQMDIFPSIQSVGYHRSTNPNPDMKKYFMGKVNVLLSSKNIAFLHNNEYTDSSDKIISTDTTVIRNVRKNQSDQIQLSILDVDGPDFINFRKILHEGYVFILLKRTKTLEYEAYGIDPKNPELSRLNELNNKFFYQKTNTIVHLSETMDELEPSSSEIRMSDGENILLYGVPGSGKSHTIDEEYCKDETKMERIVFHPDYMNTDFIGQILPTIEEDKKISYIFTPGPFTRIMKKAWKDPVNMYYLIIEEINRGNAPAIFGEVFQLLDRKNAESHYGISNQYISEQMYGKGNSDKQVKIPSNLSILATMNTADQNVFTLDTAFQRRWTMRMVENDVSIAEHAEMEILDTGVTWERFNNVINDQILNSNSSTMSSEDKRLGAFFITKETLLKDIQNFDGRAEDEKFHSLFAEKVIKYLWDDAFKFGRDRLFVTTNKSLEKVINEFSNSKGESRFDIFNESIKDLLLKKVEGSSNLGQAPNDNQNSEVDNDRN